MKSKLIAPCGMNCGVCMAYLRDKNTCPGCRIDDPDKAYSCIHCKIKNCPRLKKGGYKYCFECEVFPCAKIKHIDKRYRAKYEMSMINNLKYIRDRGIRKFVQREKKRWIKGDKVYCVHHHKYYPIKN